jgi:G2/mitotic-specific cyclin 1/2
VTADSKVDIPAGKRKREALGEVAVAGNKPVGAAAKGKEKEKFDGVVIKQRGVATRQPLRTVAGSRPTTAAAVKKAPVKEIQEDQEVIIVSDENAMVIDPPPPVAFSSLTVRKSNLIKESHITVARHSEAHRRVSSRSHATHQDEDDLEVDQPAHKKRRTSSVPPEEDPQALEEARAQAEEDEHNVRLAAEMAAFAEEEEADPEDSAWDNLDADDSDDPLMVSEYVQDIFQYLKEVEVCFFFILPLCSFINYTPSSLRQCPIPTIWRVKRSSLGKCEAS